ncbi:MAG: TlyA family RNA methyltransferase [Coriobacteriales bacterium]|nr:TlyA family RNA methyltransferase [Coriobacteriales bacterium]
MAKRIRLDDLLVSREFFASADEAARACFAGEVTSNDVHITAPSQLVSPGIDIRVKRTSRFVSRGGDKLQGALDSFGFSPEGMRCIDAGCSTGGFTDCLLQSGAESVSAVDVGYGQFALKLRNDERVRLFERTNIKHATCEQLGGPFDLLVADLSFISLESLLATFRNLLGDSGFALLLVKPQFEADKDRVEDSGVVWKASEHINVLERVLKALEREGFALQGLTHSPLRGPAGNIEFFILARLGAESVSIDIANAVSRAHVEVGDH